MKGGVIKFFFFKWREGELFKLFVVRVEIEFGNERVSVVFIK